MGFPLATEARQHNKTAQEDRVYSLLKLARHIEHVIHRAHDWIVWVGLILALAGIWPLITEKLYLGWKLQTGLGLIAANFGLRWLIKGVLRFAESALLTPASNAVNTSNKLIYEPVTEDTVEKLAHLSSIVYPQGFVSKVGRDKKIRTYQRWFQANPCFAYLIFTKGKTKKLVGFSIVLRITYETYLQYRNGDAIPWDWSKSDFLDADADGPFYLFSQAIYCRRWHGRSEGAFLTHCYLTHIWHYAKNKRPLILAPNITSSGKKNSLTLGFERCRASESGMDLFELDCRRIEELSKDAQATASYIRSLSAAQSM